MLSLQVMKKILVIEDDELVRDSVSLSLESAGYDVMEAVTCEEGLQNNKHVGVAAIISDVVSLENEGGELLRRFCLQSPDIPLITLMGTLSYAGKTSATSQAAMPMSPHILHKPFTLDELLATVQGALAR
ncbi:MAG: response regulator [Nitrospirota bacterium]|nr:response regulator [Nitrospirota bacterium]